MLRSASDTGTRGPKGEIAFGLAATNQHTDAACVTTVSSLKRKSVMPVIRRNIEGLGGMLMGFGLSQNNERIF